MSTYKLGWILTHDHVNSNVPSDLFDSNAQGGERFRIKDDDGILYYEGRMFLASLTGFEPLDWAMYYVGATTIEYLDETTNAWKVL